MAFEPVTDLHLEVCIVPQQLGHSAAKGKDDKEKEKHPLDDVDDHLAEGDLERTKVGVDREQVGHLSIRSFTVGHLRMIK